MGAIVIGTAGHIDHGKTSLLRALTGMDADRLPEEQRRGMTIDVGYAHLRLDDATEIDFVDVPGHDRLVANMLVGAGEIDAALVVVAADDGPRAQTLEHLELLDALGVQDAVAVVTKIDLVEPARVGEVVAETEELLAATSLAGSRVIPLSSETSDGIDELRGALAGLRDRVAARALTRPAGPVRLAIDRVFAVKGRGSVVTGSLRGGEVVVGESLRLEPGGSRVRVREIQVHGEVRGANDAGRTAMNLADVEADDMVRGAVLTTGAGIEATSRVLVLLRPPARLGGARRLGAARVALPVADGAPSTWPPKVGSHFRLHIGTAQVDASVAATSVWDDAESATPALLRLDDAIATFVGDRGLLRDPSSGGATAGVVILDPVPPRGVSRRRATPERLATLVDAIHDGDAATAADAIVGIHGAIAVGRIESVFGALRARDQALHAARAAGPTGSPGLLLAPDVVDALEAFALGAVSAHHDADAASAGIALTDLRHLLSIELRRRATILRTDQGAASAAIDAVFEALVRRGRLAREGERLRDPARVGIPPALAGAMDRLEALLDVAAPPDLSAAAEAAGCPPDGIVRLAAAGRIVRVEADLAWAAPAFQRLAATALAMARTAPLTPASLRDATGTSRRVVMPLLEDLGRRGILSRTPAGHVPGPNAPRATAATGG